MANQKVSQLPSGNPAQSADELLMARSGVSYSVTAASVAALASGSGTVSAGLAGQLATYAANGTVVSGNAFDLFYPEIYGALGNGVHDDTTAIQAAIAAAASNGGGTVVFGANKNYLISSALTITANNIRLRGAGARTSLVTSNSTTADILQITGSGSFGSGTNIFFTEIEQLGFRRNVTPSGTCKGLNFNLCVVAKINVVESWDSIYCFYQTNCGQIDYSQSQAVISVGSGTSYGYYYDGANGNNSSRNIDSITAVVGGTNTVYGLYLSGAIIADLYCEGFETGGVDTGVYIASTSHADGSLSNFYNQNIRFVRPEIEFKVNAFSINNVYGENSYVEISDGYVAQVNSNAQIAIDIENSSGVIVSGMNIRCCTSATTTSPGLQINGANSKNNIITGNSFYVQNAGTPIVLNTTSGNNISDNSIYGYASAAFSIGIKLLSATYNVINGNTIAGSGTTGISLDSGSNHNGGMNVVNLTSITTGVSDSGTLNYVTASGQVGGLVKLSEVILGAPASTISFSSIPSGFRNLRLVITGRSDDGNGEIYLQYNGDVGANYQYALGYQGTSSGSFSAFSLSVASVGSIALSTSPANQAGATNITIHDYARTSFFKSSTSLVHRLDTAATAFILHYGMTWNSTAAITSLVLGKVAGTGNFAAGTVATLYLEA